MTPRLRSVRPSKLLQQAMVKAFPEPSWSADSDGKGRCTMTMPEPPSANRWWRKWRGRMVLSKEAREYKARAAFLGTFALIEGDVSVSVTWYRGRKAGDLDKRIGVILDALQGLVYTNDSQITELTARRIDDPRNARVVVTVCPAPSSQPTPP